MRRVCVFYSKGRNYLDVLRRVRAEYGKAELTAMTPPNYRLSHQEVAVADAVETTERAAYSAKDPKPFLRLVGRIRNARYDVFVITFDSTRLRILAALSGAKQCAWCSLDGQIVRIRPTVVGALASAGARNVGGRLVYAWLWAYVRLAKVKPGGASEANRE